MMIQTSAYLYSSNYSQQGRWESSQQIHFFNLLLDFLFISLVDSSVMTEAHDSMCFSSIFL